MRLLELLIEPKLDALASEQGTKRRTYYGIDSTYNFNNTTNTQQH